MPQTVRLERMESDLAPTRERTARRFPGVIDPKLDRGHRIRYALEKTPEGGAPLDVVIELRQGYVDEDNLGDLLMEWPHTNIGDEKEITHPIPIAVAKGITDYADLWLCMVANQRPRGSQPRRGVN